MELHIMAMACFLSFICNIFFYYAVMNSASARPSTVKLGCAFSLNSTIGKVAKTAIHAAIDDINSSPSILRETVLKLIVRDTKSSRFQAVLESKSSNPAICFVQFS